ncbi:MAG: hypothetical protein ACE5FT_01095 [Candidatus Nanoarchaeia archaeon]
MEDPNRLAEYISNHLAKYLENGKVCKPCIRHAVVEFHEPNGVADSPGLDFLVVEDLELHRIAVDEFVKGLKLGYSKRQHRVTGGRLPCELPPVVYGSRAQAGDRVNALRLVMNAVPENAYGLAVVESFRLINECATGLIRPELGKLEEGQYDIRRHLKNQV